VRAGAEPAPRSHCTIRVRPIDLATGVKNATCLRCGELPRLAPYGTGVLLVPGPDPQSFCATGLSTCDENGACGAADNFHGRSRGASVGSNPDLLPRPQVAQPSWRRVRIAESGAAENFIARSCGGTVGSLEGF